MLAVRQNINKRQTLLSSPIEDEHEEAPLDPVAICGTVEMLLHLCDEDICSPHKLTAGKRRTLRSMSGGDSDSAYTALAGHTNGCVPEWSTTDPLPYVYTLLIKYCSGPSEIFLAKVAYRISPNAAGTYKKTFVMHGHFVVESFVVETVPKDAPGSPN
ncbi:hypothetical protein MTO96_041896 [Rhipicephalus appendiculatus]